MAWNPNIPQPGDLISQSQDQILQNFQALDPLFNTTGQYVLLPLQASAPATSTTQLALYSKTSVNTSSLELYMRRANNGAEIQVSGKGTSWSYLPSGLLLKWGAGVANGLTTVTFPTGSNEPAFTTIYSIQVTTSFTGAGDGNGFVRSVEWLAPWTSFDVYGSFRTALGANSVGFQYLAIGI